MIAKRLPELLAPAGTPLSLRAAIDAGADAVYFGGPCFNARMRAQNFTVESMHESIDLCHAYGVRAYVTLNTLVTDRELPAFLKTAADAHNAGADALIVADLGGAAAIHRYMPEIELHASTQASGHNVAAARALKALGFSRMVLARESTAENIRYFTANCDMETEIFIHGALCVSHSGQCLFSSLVGGRSGNRGECAQPCRLPDQNGKYPLSLKDLCLARHVPTLIDMGVHSLKIEGRLKSPEYVRDVVSVWRRLLDEQRAATDAEMRFLEGVFSRGGFTDAYFNHTVGPHVMGVRSEENKEHSRATPSFTDLTRRVPLDMTFVMKKEEPLSLSCTANGKTVTVKGELPLLAKTAPMNEESIKKNLCRLGNTPYTARRVDIIAENGLMVPVSHLNHLRRLALSALQDNKKATANDVCSYTPPTPKGIGPLCTARFERADGIPAVAHDYFTHIYLPLAHYAPPADGVVLPAVIFDSETADVRRLLENAVKKGAKHALIGNVGHLSLATEAGLIPHGDFRLNVTNSETLSFLLTGGFVDVLLSPELTLPQIRDIPGARDAIIYGRIPLMTLEKCLGKEVGDCKQCQAQKNALTDRRGEKFPVLRHYKHRSVIVNSRPTVMSDKKRALADAGIPGGHFIFTIETAAEAANVIKAYQNGVPLVGPVRRI